MNKELIKELALECIKNDKFEALKIILNLDKAEEKRKYIRKEINVQKGSIDKEVIISNIKENKVKHSLGNCTMVDKSYYPIPKTVEIKRRGRTTGIRVGGKLSNYYDYNNLNLDLLNYKEGVLSKKEAATLLYLFSKYKTVNKVALASGLKISSIIRYATYLSKQNLLVIQGNIGVVTNNSLLYLNK